MNFKEFFKPTIEKIILFLLIFIFFTFLPTGFLKDGLSINPFPEINDLGLPLSFYHQECSDLGRCANVINYLNLVVDIIFWYLLSCLTILVSSKVKSKK